MDYNDYIDNSDDELYDLVVARCHTTMTYYMKYINKELCRDSEQTDYRWLIDCLTGNEAKCTKCSK